jgi:mRNA-degrading endonuclease YafQ of YafQ-DinJ toxin-antitoxin module
MWIVEFESVKAQHEIETLKKAGKLTLEDQAIISAWIRQISFHGPESIQGDYKWADHALENEWKGYRSSSFSNQGRIIYRIEEKKITILIARITDIHDYEKEGKKP